MSTRGLSGTRLRALERLEEA